METIWAVTWSGISITTPGEYIPSTGVNTKVTVQLGKWIRFTYPNSWRTSWTEHPDHLWGNNIYLHSKDDPHTYTVGPSPEPILRKVSGKNPHPSKRTLTDEKPLSEANNVTRYLPVIDDVILTYHPKTGQDINSGFWISMERTTNENGVWV